MTGDIGDHDPTGDEDLLDPPPVSPMLDWTVYETATGAVIRSGKAAPDDAVLQASGAGEAVILGHVDGSTQYLPGGVPTLRPTLAFDKLTIAADGEDNATLLLWPLRLGHRRRTS